MKQYTHAWLSFMAIERLEKAKVNPPSNRVYATDLVRWFKNHNDDVIQGAWYPDAVVKDMANSHVLKMKPSSRSENEFKSLPDTYHCYRFGKKSPVRTKSFVVEEHDNLPDRCEAIAHSVIDHLKMQCCEDKGSPVSPTNNQIGLLLFMLSHYIADAHVPFHCDARKLGRLHCCVEKRWDDMIRHNYEIDEGGGRFLCNKHGYPEEKKDVDDRKAKELYPYLEGIKRDHIEREFIISWGRGNNNVWDFTCAICQHSYLLSYYFVPMHCGSGARTIEHLGENACLSFEEYSRFVLSDAIDSIARVWFRIWRRYMKWKAKQSSKRKITKKTDSKKKKR